MHKIFRTPQDDKEVVNKVTIKRKLCIHHFPFYCCLISFLGWSTLSSPLKKSNMSTNVCLSSLKFSIVTVCNSLLKLN